MDSWSVDWKMDLRPHPYQRMPQTRLRDNESLIDTFCNMENVSYLPSSLHFICKLLFIPIYLLQ